MVSPNHDSLVLRYICGSIQEPLDSRVDGQCGDDFKQALNSKRYDYRKARIRLCTPTPDLL